MPKKTEQNYYNMVKNIVYEKRLALYIAAIYCLLGSLWILLSDRFVEILFKERSTILFISIIKGWLYVALTSILIYFLVNYALRQVQSQQQKINDINKELTQKVSLLDESNTMLKAIIESSPQVIIFALDRNYCYTTFNTKHKAVMKDIWGKDIELGMNMLEVIGNQTDRHKAQYNFDKAMAGESFSLTEEYGDEKLKRLTWMNYYSPVYSHDGNMTGLTCFVLNITERKKAEEEILYLSYHDALTGLFNRRFYEEEIRRLDTERNLPISIIVGDVNGLKLINDAFGHEIPEKLDENTPEQIRNLFDVSRNLNLKNIQECYNDALYYRDEIRDMMDSVPADIWDDGIAYVALGHIHHAQHIGADNVRYSGSVLPMSFDENYQHSVTIVKFEKERMSTLQKIEIKPPIAICTIPEKAASFDEVKKALSNYPDDEPAYLRANILSEGVMPADMFDEANSCLKDKTKLRLCTLLQVRKQQETPEEDSNIIHSLDELRKISPIEVAKRSYKIKKQEEMPEELITCMREAIEGATTETKEDEQ